MQGRRSGLLPGRELEEGEGVDLADCVERAWLVGGTVPPRPLQPAQPPVQPGGEAEQQRGQTRGPA